MTAILKQNSELTSDQEIGEIQTKVSTASKLKIFFSQHLKLVIAGIILLILAVVVTILCVLFVPQSSTTTSFESSKGSVVKVAQEINGTRTLIVDPSGNLLTIARGTQKVYAFWEDSADSYNSKIVLDAENEDYKFTHGLAYHENYIYISSDTTVYRFSYDHTTASIANPKDLQVIIKNMSSRGSGGAPLGHFTRTILFGPDGLLYVGISSNNNVDPNSDRARVLRFRLENIPVGGFDFNNDGELWADGLRNPLALAFDKDGILWELDNGPDNVKRDDIKQYLYEDNPVEELNKLEGPAGTFYGYPYCFSIGNITTTFGNDPKYLEQYAWDSFMPTFTDQWCQDPSNNRRPLLGLPAHSSPIQMVFVNTTNCDQVGTIPCSWNGDLLATLHGSWNRPIPAGFSVVRIPFKGTLDVKNVEVIGQTTEFHKCVSKDGSQLKCFRPAGIALKNGQVFVSSDSTGDIIKIKF